MGGVIYSNGTMFSSIIPPLLKGILTKEEIIERYQKKKTGGMTDKEYWKGIANPDEIIEKTAEQLKPDPDLNIIKELKFDKIIMLSNHISRFARVSIEKDHIEEYFDEIFISEEIGFAKPDKAFYWYALEKIQAKPEECIFVDDQLKNLVPAKEIGIKTVYFKRREDSLKFKPDYTITSLKELKDIEF